MTEIIEFIFVVLVFVLGFIWGFYIRNEQIKNKELKGWNSEKGINKV